MNTKVFGNQNRDCVTTNLEDAVEAWQALAEPLATDWLLSAQGVYQAYSDENTHIVPAIKSELERASGFSGIQPYINAKKRTEPAQTNPVLLPS